MQNWNVSPKYKYFMTVLDFPLLKALTYLVSVTLLGY